MESCCLRISRQKLRKSLATSRGSFRVKLAGRYHTGDIGGMTIVTCENPRLARDCRNAERGNEFDDMAIFAPDRVRHRRGADVDRPDRSDDSARVPPD